MFKFLLPLAILACAYALPVAEEKPEYAEILTSEINKNDDGSYKLNYETSDGIVRAEEADLVKDADSDDSYLEVKGSYKYIDDMGNEVEVFYTAGKNGFVPYGKTINADITKTAQEAKDLPRLEDTIQKV